MSTSTDAPAPASRSGEVVAIQIAMTSLAGAVLLLRLATRVLIKRTWFGADDWVITAAWLFSLAFAVDVCIQTRFGLGKHLADLPPATKFAASLELFYFGEALYYITVALTKISILFLYLQLSPHHTFRVLVWGLMAFVALTAFVCVVAGLFQCNPIHRAWDTDVPGTCFDQVALYMSNAGLNIAQDVLIYFLPVRMLWRLQLPRKQRLALILVFVVGGFVVVTGVLRLQSLKVASVSTDPTWDNFGAAIWSSIESNVGIVCASLVHFKSLIARYAPAILGISRGPSSSNPSSSGLEGGKNAHRAGLRTFGRSHNSGRKIGILTELKMEEETAGLVSSQVGRLHHGHAGAERALGQRLELDPQVRNPLYEMRTWVGQGPKGGPPGHPDLRAGGRGGSQV